MIKYLAAFSALIILGVAVTVAGAGRSRNAKSVVPDSSASKAVLGVETLMRAPDRYPGRVRVEGVVSAVAAKQQTLALIDTREFQQCGTVDCAELALPVRWTGPMPAVRQTIRVEGQVQEAGGKLVFVARRLEKVQPPSGGRK